MSIIKNTVRLALFWVLIQGLGKAHSAEMGEGSCGHLLYRLTGAGPAFESRQAACIAMQEVGWQFAQFLAARYNDNGPTGLRFIRPGQSGDIIAFLQGALPQWVDAQLDPLQEQMVVLAFFIIDFWQTGYRVRGPRPASYYTKRRIRALSDEIDTWLEFRIAGRVTGAKPPEGSQLADILRAGAGFQLTLPNLAIAWGGVLVGVYGPGAPLPSWWTSSEPFQQMLRHMLLAEGFENQIRKSHISPGLVFPPQGQRSTAFRQKRGPSIISHFHNPGGRIFLPVPQFHEEEINETTIEFFSQINPELSEAVQGTQRLRNLPPFQLTPWIQGSGAGKVLAFRDTGSLEDNRSILVQMIREAGQQGASLLYDRIAGLERPEPSSGILKPRGPVGADPASLDLVNYPIRPQQTSIKRHGPPVQGSFIIF
ncbi:MAG: hypothetical protein LBI20_02570 [Holosporales bacterium]|jgi:hypothetical protein|nr:hypothetical protein [Holosporales bacterium]